MSPTHATSEVISKALELSFVTSAWQTFRQSMITVFSPLQQVTQMLSHEESFFLKAQREVHFQRYQLWCAQLRQAERQLLAQLKERTVHPVVFRKALLAQQQAPERTIISPVYYQQCLTRLEKKIKRLSLPSIFSENIREAKARFRESLQARPDISVRYFYHDVINQLIQLSGRQLLPRTLLDALGYYKDLMPEKMYQSTMTLLEQFIAAHQEELTTIDDLYLEHCVSNKDYKTLLTAINAVFMTEMMPIEPFEKSEVAAPQTLKITPRFVAVAAAAASAGALISYGLLNSNINFQNTWTWIQDSFEQTAKNAWTNVNVTPMWSVVTQATLSYGVFYQASSLNPGIWGGAGALSALFSMSTAQFPAQFNVSSLNGVNGFEVREGPWHIFAETYSIGSGDINGDNITDLLIGIPSSGPGYYRGRSYVMFGSKNPFPVSLDLTDLNGVNGFAINGAKDFDQSGSPISSGDINGDGITDLLIGALGGNGQIYVVFGSRNPFPASFNATNLNGTNGFMVNGTTSNFFGESISSGDINGDGIADVLIGAPQYGSRLYGQSYVVYGSRNPFPASFSVMNLNGTNGFVVNGTESHDDLGVSISSGDINGDGITDLLIGATPMEFLSYGQSYVIFGSRNPFPATFEITSLNGANGFMINGTTWMFGNLGASISSGDINGDGITDFLIGASNALNSYGQSYVVYGSRNPFPATFDIASLNGSNGFVLNGVNFYDYSGYSVSSGDINGDGIADVLIGAPQYGSRLYGQSYVVYGSRNPFPANFSLAILNGANGFVVRGANKEDECGRLISSGDINGDNIMDLLIGTYNEYVGQCYVVFGRNASVVTTGAPTSNHFTTGSVTTGPMTTGDITTTGTSGFGTTGSNSISASGSTTSNQISSSIVNKADKGLIGGIVAGSLMLIICVGGIAFYLYQRQKRQHQSPESQPLLGTADFRDYDTLELSNAQTKAAAILEQEQREELQTEQEEEFHIVAQQTLSADKKPHDQPKESGSLPSNPSSVKLYQTSAVKQTFFYAGAKAEQKNELLNIDSPSDAPSHVASSNNLKQQFSLNLKS